MISPQFRHFNVYNTEVSKDTVKNTISKTVELAEYSSQKEIENTQGALLFGSRSKTVLHYVVSYIQEVPVRKRDIILTENIQRITLIALSPIEKTSVTPD